MNHPEHAPASRKWNFVAFAVDYAFFTIALSFINPDSVLPAFVRHFTHSKLVVGLVSTIFTGAWLLPQLVAARLINDKPRKKPYLTLGISGRILFWFVILALWLGLGQHPTAMLVLFFVCFGVFTATDGLASIAWFDILARALPVRLRGRMMGIGQIIGGLAGLGVGRLVGWLLSTPRLAFPDDYTLIFVLGSVSFIPSVVALLALREPPPRRPEPDEEKAEIDGAGWVKPLLSDSLLRRLLLSRLLIGSIAFVTPFYVGHATDVLGLSAAAVGRFVTAQRLAGAAAGALLGFISERWGPRHVIRLGGLIGVLGPLFALAAHLVGRGWWVRGYAFVYVALGIVRGAWMMGFFNYLLEIAPESLRPSYVGLSNTSVGVLALAPMVGGWLLESTSYPVLFGLTAGLMGLGFIVALRLKPCVKVPASRLTL